MTQPPSPPVAPGTPRPHSCQGHGRAAIATYLLLFAAFQVGALVFYGQWAAEADPADPTIPWLPGLLWLAPAADAVRRAAHLIWGLDD